MHINIYAYTKQAHKCKHEQTKPVSQPIYNWVKETNNNNKTLEKQLQTHNNKEITTKKPIAQQQ